MTFSVSIHNLSKLFPKQKKPAIQSISANLSSGKIIGLVGPDGAGKTTLIRMIVGLLTPTSGTAKVFGIDSFLEASKVHETLSYMPQKFGLYDELSVQQNFDLYADLHEVVEEEKEGRANELLEFAGLIPFRNRLAKKLSGGMQQKLGLICALLRRPKLLILDEPTVGVDPISRREFWSMMETLCREGISILWSTSYLDEAEKCDEVLLLNEGELIYFGFPAKLTDQLEGRTFLIPNLGENKRRIFLETLSEPSITDSTIQGDSVRIVLKDPSEILKKWNLNLTLPRFEDAFVDKLGGGPKGLSPLSKKIPFHTLDHRVVIEAKNLTKRFGSFIAVDNVNFTVRRGEIFGLLGPNGAGKSTTFRMLCGLMKPTSGESYVKGISLQDAPGDARAQIGYMAQKFSLYGNMTVYQNLRFFSGVYPVDRKQRSQVIDELVHVFSLEPYLDSPAGELPLGYKQRLALSCALIHKPEVLFLDEATSGVDPVTRREFWNHIQGIVERGCTIMVTTHFMDEAEYCDRIGLLSQSRLITVDTPDALKERVRSKTLPQPTLEDAFVLLTHLTQKE